MENDNLRDKLRERFKSVRRPAEVKPAPKNKPAGLYQHFDTEESHQNHLAEIAKNQGEF